MGFPLWRGTAKQIMGFLTCHRWARSRGKSTDPGCAPCCRRWAPSPWKSMAVGCPPWCRRRALSPWKSRWALSPWKSRRGCPPRGRRRWGLTWKLWIPSQRRRTCPSEMTKGARWWCRMANCWQRARGDQRRGHGWDRRRLNPRGWGGPLNLWHSPPQAVVVDDLDVIAGGRDMPAYSSPLLECLPPVMVVSFLGDVGRRDRDTPLLGQSLLELHRKHSRA